MKTKVETNVKDNAGLPWEKIKNIPGIYQPVKPFNPRYVIAVFSSLNNVYPTLYIELDSGLIEALEEETVIDMKYIRYAGELTIKLQNV